MNSDLALNNKRTLPSVEIDSDLAEILELLSSMVSSLGEVEDYFIHFTNGLRSLTGVQQIFVWLALERGDELIYVPADGEGQSNAKNQFSLDTKLVEDLTNFSTQKTVRQYADLANRALFYEKLSLRKEAHSFITFPIVALGDQVGLVMFSHSGEIEFSESVQSGIESLLCGAGIFLHNANLLKDVRTLFHDLDYMIQEWIKDVSGRLEKVQQSESLLGKILSDLSHEFRTPIASLNLYSGLIEKRPENQKRYLDTMQIELSRLEQILEGVLELSEFNVFSSKNQLQPIQVSSFFERYQGQFKTALENFDADLKYDLESLPSTIMANEDYLYRALLQLVINSAKYGNGSQIDICTKQVTLQDDSEQPDLVIRVTDHGLGIAENDIPHIFNPFYRGEGVGQSTIFGVGLGLTFAREIIQFFGGSLVLVSSDDNGTIMEARLPLI